MIRSIVMCVGILLLAIGPGSAQVITGRSAAGPLAPAVGDSSLAKPPTQNHVVTYETEFSEPSGDNFLEPRETGRLRLILTNTGKSTLRSIVARIVPLAPPSGVSYNDSISVGDIPGNATRYAIFYFSADENVTSQILTFQIDIHDSQGVVADSRLITFLTKERKGG
jgi:hypothetical protein